MPPVPPKAPPPVSSRSETISVHARIRLVFGDSSLDKELARVRSNNRDTLVHYVQVYVSIADGSWELVGDIKIKSRMKELIKKYTPERKFFRLTLI